MSLFIAFVLIIGWVWHHAHKHGWHPGRKMYVTKAVRSPRQRQDGWIYFACGAGTPVLVGTSPAVPTGGNVPELDRAATPMRVVYKFHADNVVEAAQRIVAELAPYHVRQGWFDRDATLFYVDHLKGAV